MMALLSYVSDSMENVEYNSVLLLEQNEILQDFVQFKAAFESFSYLQLQ